MAQEYKTGQELNEVRYHSNIILLTLTKSSVYYLANFPKILFIICLQAGKKKGNEVLQQWVSAVRNHFWHCSKDCDGDLENMKV